MKKVFYLLSPIPLIQIILIGDGFYGWFPSIEGFLRYLILLPFFLSIPFSIIGIIFLSLKRYKIDTDESRVLLWICTILNILVMIYLFLSYTVGTIGR